MFRKAKITLAAAALLLSCASLAYAQSKSLPTVKVDGKEYYYYDVQPKETLFSISKQLGISRESIIQSNPQVADGLQAYTRLYFPVETSSSASGTAASTPTTHKVERGETLYGISKAYGITVDRLLQLNPSARDGIKAGDELIVSGDVAAASASNAASKAQIASTHTIAQGETLYRIASDNGVTVEQLLAVNPGIDTLNYSAGTVINIPVGSSSSQASAAPKQTASEQAFEAAKASQAAKAAQAEAAAKTAATASQPTYIALPKVLPEPEVKITGDLHIALMLPLMLNQSTPSKSAELFTDFYKGFLLAADSLSHKGNVVRIHVYDTANSLDTVKALMKLPEMAKMNVIVGPDNDQQLSAVIAAADADDTFIFNMFVPKDESHLKASNVIQANIPRDEMYEKAANAFFSKYADRLPVFLSRIGGNAEKDEFTSILKKRLADRQMPYREVTYRDVLSADELAELPLDSTYVFVPVSGTRTEFIKITPALKQLNNDLPSKVALFGYPEWLTFRGDSEEDLGTLNATIYSRFYNDDAYFLVRDVKDKFMHWYGKEMRPSVPAQGILGFDVGYYLISAVRTNGGDFHLKKYNYDGLQTNFTLDDSEVEGLVNTSLLLVTFSPEGLVVSSKI